MKKTIFLFILLGINTIATAQAPYFPQFNQEKDAWHYLDVDGKIVLELKIPAIENSQPFSDGLAAVQDAKTHLWGYIDTKGKWQIKPAFEVADEFKDGYAIITNKCKVDCNTSDEGFLNDNIGTIIDKNGKVIFSDASQEEEPYKRYFLDRNLGHGLFSVVFGYGFNDMKNIVNFQGNVLCDTYSVFGGSGDVIFDDEMQAYRCRNQYYNLKGEMVLDLSKYTYVQTYSNGYAWVSAEVGEDEETSVTWNFLLDKTGKEIARFESDLFFMPEQVIDGSFKYTNENSELYEYNLKTKEKVAKELSEIEQDYQFTIGDRERNGCRFFYSADDEMAPMMGFINAKGEVFYKNGVAL